MKIRLHKNVRHRVPFILALLYFSDFTNSVECIVTGSTSASKTSRISFSGSIFRFTAGESGVSYVANTGVELFHHAYSTILRCATGVDGITFAYIIKEKEEGDQQYTCHVLQCLTPKEVYTDGQQNHKIKYT